MRFFGSLLAFAASSLALTITSPSTTNEKVDFSKEFTIRWTSVQSDPDNFTITLVNQLGHRVNKDLAVNVDSSKEEYVVKSVSDIPIANNYQINFRSTDRNNMGILAQSAMFNVTEVAEKEEEEEEEPTQNATTTTASAAEPTEENAASGRFVASGLLAGVLGVAALGL
ncbi:hypothetical protein BJY04DRAFT_212995 [Aspergillus karnatakaensis]|uniref:GPI anchored serine-threonine rich family protein n=1 Tax=Aspergillus karnatakaensis TaxID=1810916 RepID=UPI003CCD70A8